MSMQDPIADMLTRIKNAQMAKLTSVSMPASSIKGAIAKVMQEQGYIASYKINTADAKRTLDINLKYYQGKPVIEDIKRYSRPGLRRYEQADTLPIIRGGLGTVIVSTSKGVMTGHQAKVLGIGGEVLCSVI